MREVRFPTRAAREARSDRARRLDGRTADGQLSGILDPGTKLGNKQVMNGKIVGSVVGPACILGSIIR